MVNLINRLCAHFQSPRPARPEATVKIAFDQMEAGMVVVHPLEGAHPDWPSHLSATVINGMGFSAIYGEGYAPSQVFTNRPEDVRGERLEIKPVGSDHPVLVVDYELDEPVLFKEFPSKTFVPPPQERSFFLKSLLAVTKKASLCRIGAVS